MVPHIAQLCCPQAQLAILAQYARPRRSRLQAPRAQSKGHSCISAWQAKALLQGCHACLETCHLDGRHADLEPSTLGRQRIQNRQSLPYHNMGDAYLERGCKRAHPSPLCFRSDCRLHNSKQHLLCVRPPRSREEEVQSAKCGAIPVLGLP
jgi:hypothetical protein